MKTYKGSYKGEEFIFSEQVLPYLSMDARFHRLSKFSDKLDRNWFDNLHAGLPPVNTQLIMLIVKGLGPNSWEERRISPSTGYKACMALIRLEWAQTSEDGTVAPVWCPLSSPSHPKNQSRPESTCTKFRVVGNTTSTTPQLCNQSKR